MPSQSRRKALHRTDLRIAIIEKELGLEEGKSLTPSRPEAKPRVSAASRVHYSMTEQDMDHPTEGRRRRHTSSSSLPAAPLIASPKTGRPLGYE